MLAPQIYNPGSRGQNARYDIRGLPEVRPGVFSDGVYEYDANGLALNRPDQHIRGLKPADAMDGDQWGDYLGPNRPRWRPDEAPQPQAEQAPAAPDEEAPAAMRRVRDADNPRAVEYALMRLAQLRALGYDFDIVEGDPTATWRNASVGVAEEARRLGYENPRDWLAGRPRPRPTRAVPSDFYESDAVRDPVELGAPAGPAEHPVMPPNVPRPGRPGPSRPAMPRGRRPSPGRPDAVQRAVRARPKPKRAPAKPVRRGRPVRAV